MLSFWDVDRVLDDALADYGAPDDIKNLVRCNRFYRVAMILGLLQTAADMRENPDLLRQGLEKAPGSKGEQARQAFKAFMDDFKERNT